MIGTTFYLALRRFKNRYGNFELEARITKRSPALQGGEVAMALKVEVPEAIFMRPSLRAAVTVAPSAVSPPVIETQVVDNVAELLRATFGCDVRITVEQPEAAS